LSAANRLGSTRRASMVARLGTVGFLFFLLKGLLWLAIPAWLTFAW
jgi:hypothetical protein